MKKTNWLILLMFLCITWSSRAQVGSIIWQEDFNTLNTSIWNVITGDGTGTPAGAGWGNQELEYYNTPNVYIADVPGESGNKALVLEARAEAVGTRAFTSGKVTTSGNLSIKYGLVEMRIRIPNLQTGLWPAGWLLGTSTASWPACGEIDMMEMGHNLAERTRQGFPNSSVNNYMGSNLIFYSADAVSSANPTGAASTAWDVNYDNPYVAATPMNDRFVTYRMYWDASSVRFTVVDGGVENDLYASPFSITSESDEFQNPFYFILNLAVGGNFTDALNNGQVTAPMPGKMYIDYIKVSKWNNQGEVTLGGPAPETGTFGVFTDNTVTTNKLSAGTSSDIYAWNNLAAGTTPAYEGSNVIAWATTTANTWFGGGIASKQPRNMSNFTNGNLKFRIKIPANVTFKVGVTDTYTNEKYITFPANTTTYGLVRDGNWGQATIPISAFAGTMAFQSMNYMFAIVSVDGQLPTSTFQLGLDDIYWEGGGGTNPVLTSIVVSPSSASVNTGSTNQFSAQGYDQNGSVMAVTPTWTVSGGGTINSSGLFTANTVGGPFTVTAQSGSVSGTASVIVTNPTVAVTGVTVSATTVSVAAGATTQLTASVSPSNATNKTVSWSSSNTSVATVSGSGLITGVAAGTANITVTTQDGGKTATCAVTVTSAGIPSPWVTSDIGSVGATGSASYSGGTFTLTASGADIWGTSDAYRSVHQSISGDVIITARVVSLTNTDGWAKAGVMVKNDLTASSAHAFTAVTAGNGTAFQRRVTASGQSTHTAGPSGAAPYWVRLQRVGNLFTSFVSTNGTSWTQIGSETITMASQVYVSLAATSHNNSILTTAVFDNVTVTSSVFVTGVSVSPTSASINTGATTQLTATVLPSNATNKTVSWSSSNTSVATVSSSGLVTTVAAGNATITVTTQDGGKTATSAITVTSNSNLALNKTTTVSSTENSSLSGTNAADGNASTRWSSAFSDPQWIYVDLGANYNVNRVKITWEAAYGKDYTVQVSSDASNWSTIKTVTGNTSLTNDNTGLSGTGRYVRIYGTARGTVYGYSIYELEVYGTPANSGCSVANASGDYSVSISNDANNPTITFVPSRTGVGSPTCILYYSTSPSGTYPGYTVTANTAYQISASSGQTIYFYYTYSVPEGGEKNTLNSKNSFTVGNCSSLKSAVVANAIAEVENNNVSAYPVPMGNMLNVKINSSFYQHITITDVSGKVIVSQSVTSDLSQIDVSKLTKGVYCLRVEGKAGSLSKMIVK